MTKLKLKLQFNKDVEGCKYINHLFFNRNNDEYYNWYWRNINNKIIHLSIIVSDDKIKCKIECSYYVINSYIPDMTTTNDYEGIKKVYGYIKDYLYDISKIIKKLDDEKRDYLLNKNINI